MDSQLDAAFAALADPTRRAIMARLAVGEASVGELAEPFEMSLPAISRHLKVLEGAKLIHRKTDAQWRRCSLNPEGLKTAADWISDYRKFWEDRLGALADYLEDMKMTREADNGKPFKTETTEREIRTWQMMTSIPSRWNARSMRRLSSSSRPGPTPSI